MPDNKRLFAVVHVRDRAQAIRESGVAFRAGCDGVFLISHGGMPALKLLNCVPDCQKEIPYVGVNFLDLSVTDALKVVAPNPPQTVWSDYTYRGPKPQGFELFSGFAFKYRPQPRSLSEAASLVDSCHVITTSGPGTGKPANIEKVAAIRDAVGDHRVALASGVTEYNVDPCLPYVDDFLVATGISKSFTELDEEMTRDLADLIHGG